MMRENSSLCDYCERANQGKCSRYFKDLESDKYVIVKQCGRYYPTDAYLDMIKSFKENTFDGKIFNKEAFH